MPVRLNKGWICRAFEFCVGSPVRLIYGPLGRVYTMIKRAFTVLVQSCFAISLPLSAICRSGLPAIILIICSGFAGAGVLAGETTVQATYTINAPIGSGKFQFASSQDGSRYKMQGAAKFKAFLGLYEWRSSIASNGYLSGVTPRPNIYAFNARADKKAERIRLNFSSSGVQNIKAIPPTKPHPQRVKLTKSHLRGVVDPLSAVLVFADKAPSLTNGSKACNRRLQIFDGRQRFDVVMSYKRKAYAELANGKSRTAFVCRAKYRPIAGHKMNQSVKYMSSSNGLEVWLVPLPKVKMYVPYKIVIPIMVGTASAELSHFKVRDPKAGVVALAK